MNINSKKPKLTVLPYPEEEDIVRQKSQLFYIQIIEPASLMVVLGASNKFENELHIDAVIKDNLPVYKRKGGGGTVLLGPGMAVITLKAFVNSPFQNKQYFDSIHTHITNTLFNKMGLKAELNGISDLAIEHKKILGSSIYRNKQLLLYQGVLLVEADIKRIGFYIKHPKRVPAYRNGRKHHDFIANISQFNPLWNTRKVIKNLYDAFKTWP